MKYIKLKDALHIIDLVAEDNTIRRTCRAIRKRLKELPTEDVEKIKSENLRLRNNVEMLEIEVKMIKEAKDRSTESAMRVINKQDAEIKLLTEALARRQMVSAEKEGAEE